MSAGPGRCNRADTACTFRLPASAPGDTPAQLQESSGTAGQTLLPQRRGRTQQHCSSGVAAKLCASMIAAVTFL